jgi:integrase
VTRGRALGPGKLERQNGRWALSWTGSDGQRHRRVLATDKRTAELARAEIIRQRDLEVAGVGVLGGQDRTLADIQADYLADLQLRVTPRHFRGVHDRLGKVVARLGEIRIRDLRAMDVVRLRNEMKAAGASNRTCDTYTHALKAMLTWAVAAGMIAANPIASLKRLPSSRDHQVYRRRSLTDAEIERLLDVARAEDEDLAIIAPGVRVPQAPLWLAFLETGARYGELTKATWGDFDQARRVLVLRAENTKSRKLRAIPVGEELAGELVGLRALHEAVRGRLPTAEERIFLTPEGATWPWHTGNVMRIFDRLLDRAGIAKRNVQGEKLDLHALRTTCASRMARRGVPLVIAQRWLGHSDPKLTAAHYVNIDVEDLRAAVERATTTTVAKKEAR